MTHSRPTKSRGRRRLRAVGVTGVVVAAVVAGVVMVHQRSTIPTAGAVPIVNGSPSRTLKDLR